MAGALLDMVYKLEVSVSTVLKVPGENSNIYRIRKKIKTGD
jgi:hypothetical protein